MAKDKGSKPKGTLVFISGHEDREGEKIILREVANRVKNGRLVVMTVASHQPEGYFEEYQRAFTDLGIRDIVEISLRHRVEGSESWVQEQFAGVTGVFFTGGDQLRITSQIGDTPVYRRICEIYEAGGIIAGTSAGASVMCETMLVSGSSRESHRIGDLRMAPGLGLIKDVIIDQHFAERGRMGRLLGAVAMNPRELGIGIDEDTAILMEDAARFTVLGSGAVTVVDATGITHSNIAEEEEDRALSIYDIKLHVLSAGDAFDLGSRRPGEVSREQAVQAEAAST